MQNEEEEFPKPTSEDIEKANKLKEEGNELVKASQFDEAIIKYNEAIKLSRDPIFFCNRQVNVNHSLSHHLSYSVLLRIVVSNSMILLFKIAEQRLLSTRPMLSEL